VIFAATSGVEPLGFEPPGEDVVEHGAEQRDVGARLHLEVDVGPPGELGATRVGDHEGSAALVRALDRRAEHRVRLRRVGARNEDHVRGVLHFAHRARRRRGVQRPLHRRDRSGVTQTCAMVDVVGPERRAEQPHQEIILFVRALGR